MSRSQRRVLLATLTASAFVALTGSVATPADAALRNPPLEAGCGDPNFEYRELTVGPWRLEGCAREVNPKTGEAKRVLFKKTVEANGMLIEGGNNLTATEKLPLFRDVTRSGRSDPRSSLVSQGSNHEYRLVRKGSDAKIVLEAILNGGEKRRNIIRTGKVDLKITSSATVNNTHKFLVDIPTDNDAEIMGLRLREDIEDAEIVRGGGNLTPDVSQGQGSIVPQGDPSTTEFSGVMSLGSSNSPLIRDWTKRKRFELVDGQGLIVENIEFKIDDISIPGIGGFEDFSIKYFKARDEWEGSVELDLGDLFSDIEFEVTVNAGTGAVTRIETAVTNLSIPVGNTGIVVREINGFFQPNPLVMGVGASATYGPRVGGFSLVELNGNLVIQLEPNFRLEVEGSARVLPTGPHSELGEGSTEVILDASGFISVSADAHFSALAGGIGVSANVSGSGAYATDRNRFNISARLRGTLHLGFIGDFTGIEVSAVVSSNGWGACGTLLEFLSGGIGQEWDSGMDVFFGCDLSRYRAPVTAGVAAAGQKTFVVGPRTDKVAVEITGAGPQPVALITDPAGNNVALTAPANGVRKAGNDAIVVSRPGQTQQLVVLRNPRAGVWKVRWGNESPEVTGIRIARDLSPIDADVRVSNGKRAGERRLVVGKPRGLDDGERIEIGIKTPNGVMPVGDVGSGGLNAAFNEYDAGPRDIVATVYRNGIPNPMRSRTLGKYRSKMPVRPGKLRAKRKGKRLRVTASLSRKALKPDAWQFVLKQRGRPIATLRVKYGKTGVFKLSGNTRRLTLTARPVVKGKVLRGAERRVNVR